MVAAVRTSHAPMPLLSKPAMLLSDCSVCQPDAVWKDTCCLRVPPCAAPQSATALVTGLRLGACPRWAVMYPVPWSEEAGHCAGIATGVGIVAFGQPLPNPDRSVGANGGAANLITTPSIGKQQRSVRHTNGSASSRISELTPDSHIFPVARLRFELPRLASF